jgi:hypothetical protein
MNKLIGVLTTVSTPIFFVSYFFKTQKTEFHTKFRFCLNIAFYLKLIPQSFALQNPAPFTKGPL